MSDAVDKVVFDCNIFAQTLITPTGHAGQCVERVLDGRISLFWSDYVLDEVRRIPEKATPKRLGVTPSQVDSLLARLLPIAHHVQNPPSIYQHPIDPKDSHYVDLALACNAGLIVSRDKHLLNLMNPLKREASDFLARFPELHVMGPEELLERLRRALVESLTELEILLVNHDYPGQAGFIRRIIDLPLRNRAPFVQLIQSVDMWGGSGAVWEIGDLGTDERRFRNAVIKLVEVMQRDGIASERARGIASVFADRNG